jgi:hypothetical protein
MGNNSFKCPNCGKKVDIASLDNRGNFQRYYVSWAKGWHKNTYNFYYYSDRDKIIKDPLGFPMITGKELDYNVFEPSSFSCLLECQKCHFRTADFRYFIE